MTKPNTHIKKRIYAYIIGLVVCVLACYWIVQASNPYMRTEPKPVSVVGDFSFIDQNGKSIDRSILDKKIALVYFFFTSCKNVCPLMYESVAQLKSAVDADKVIVLAHTCDPDVDDVPTLKRYATDKGADERYWHFLTGEKKPLYEAARFFYKIHDATQAVDSSYNFMHTQYVAIVNDGKVVMIIDGLKNNELEEGQDKLRALVKKNENK